MEKSRVIDELTQLIDRGNSIIKTEYNIVGELRLNPF